MKFDCGLSREEKNRRKLIERSNWHDWFAWWPTRVAENDCRWLEIIERKGKYHEGYGDSFWEWKYRNKL